MTTIFIFTYSAVTFVRKDAILEKFIKVNKHFLTKLRNNDKKKSIYFLVNNHYFYCFIVEFYCFLISFYNKTYTVVALNSSTAYITFTATVETVYDNFVPLMGLFWMLRFCIYERFGFHSNTFLSFTSLNLYFTYKISVQFCIIVEILLVHVT